MYQNVNNLNGQTISENLPVHGFEWRKYKFAFKKKFTQDYDKDSDKGYIFK